MTYNQLLILNTESKILKINRTKQDNYHRAGSGLKRDINACRVMSCHGMTLHLNNKINVEPRHGVAQAWLMEYGRFKTCWID
jgi:hypothetical protein